MENNNKNIVKLGVCKGRHDIPDVSGYVFDSIEDVTNVRALERRAFDVLESFGLWKGNGELRLYVTGLTVATCAVINICAINGVSLTLYHYDRETDTYFAQPMATREDCDLVVDAYGHGASYRC